MIKILEKKSENFMENKIIEEILKEKERQVSIWGEQNHLSVYENYKESDCEDKYGIVIEENAKFLCEDAVNKKELTWAHIAVEELSEVINAKNEKDRREEIIQLCAVLVSWIESLERNGK